MVSAEHPALVVAPGLDQDDAPLEQVRLPQAPVDGLEEGQREEAADLVERDVDHDVVHQAFKELDLRRRETRLGGSKMIFPVASHIPPAPLH